MKRLARSTVAVAIAVFAIGWLVLTGCNSSDPAPDAVPEPPDLGAPVGDCCNWFLVPLAFDKPQVCLEKRTNITALAVGQCRWIDCLGGLRHYEVCR